MWTKLTVVGCVLLTAVVVHTALRIEHVNHQMGTFLPRAPGYEQEAWGVPERDHVMSYVDAQIAKQRANVFAVDHPDEKVPPTESFVGEPYSQFEKSFIERHKRDYATFQELHWWVYGFGAIQYGLAPLAFVWSIGNVLALQKARFRLLSTLCAGLAFGAIFLMIFRGY